jgi:hypothetical protein
MSERLLKVLFGRGCKSRDQNCETRLTADSCPTLATYQPMHKHTPTQKESTLTKQRNAPTQGQPTTAIIDRSNVQEIHSRKNQVGSSIQKYWRCRSQSDCGRIGQQLQLDRAQFGDEPSGGCWSVGHCEGSLYEQETDHVESNGK